MKWEYKIVYVNAKQKTSSGLPENVNEQFNEYGRDGWELVKVEPKLEGWGMIFGIGWIQTAGYVAFFKKPISEN